MLMVCWRGVSSWMQMSDSCGCVFAVCNHLRHNLEITCCVAMPPPHDTTTHQNSCVPSYRTQKAEKHSTNE
jgi:hypothetical protein